METHSVAAETDTLLGVENGTLRKKNVSVVVCQGLSKFAILPPKRGT